MVLEATRSQTWLRLVGWATIASLAACNNESAGRLPSVGQQAVPCSAAARIVGNAPAPNPATDTVVLGAVALPSERGATLTAVPREGAFTTKIGILVRSRSALAIEILSSNPAITTTFAAATTRSFAIGPCESADMWLAFPTTWETPEPICIRVRVFVGEEHRDVGLPVGKPCT